MSAPGDALEQRVTPLELFFDLVFVFAITRVTGLMADDLSWTSIGQGLLVLAALWWGWSAYAWLTNHVSGNDWRARVVVFIAMSAMVLVALAVPEAFDSHALLFALGYLVMRMGHLGLYWVASRDDPDVHRAVLLLLPSATTGPLLLVLASAADGTVQAALWIAALVIDYGGPLVIGVAGYRVHPAHFAERFGLVVIIALGESIVAIGVGAGAEPLDFAVAVSAVLAVIGSAALWWAYFGAVAPLAHDRLTQLSGPARNLLARDAFAYLHLPLIVGIQLFALGVEQTVAHVDEALDPPAAAALFGGVGLYLLAHVALRLRVLGTLNPYRLVAGALSVAAIPLATEVRAPVALALVTAIAAAVIVVETALSREPRVRAA
jgi:low temperature requirement protein LtrA